MSTDIIRSLISIFSGVLVFASFIPYALDIMHGRAKPARSTRMMLAVITVLALLQQHSLGSGWTLAVTAGETLGASVILGFALKKGVGGLNRLDLICYTFLLLVIMVWLTTKNTLLALHLTILTECIAVTPTLVKTWYRPDSETPLFFIIGVITAIMSIIGGGNYAYAIILFPLYLALINLVTVALIYRSKLSRGVIL